MQWTKQSMHAMVDMECYLWIAPFTILRITKVNPTCLGGYMCIAAKRKKFAF